MSEVNGTEGPKYGRRLPLHVVQERLATAPDSEWVSIPRGSEPEDGWEKITYRQFGKAINYVAKKIIDFAGPAPEGQFPTIAFIALNDSRYISFVFGAMKAGYKALFISPRNSTEGQIKLFQDTDCRFIAHSPEFQDSVNSWKELHDLKNLVITPERDFYYNEEPSTIDYEKTFEEGEWDPYCVLHTSGSTGFPKPIVCKQGWLAAVDTFYSRPSRNSVYLWTVELSRRSERCIFPMPFFHAAGMYITVFIGIYCGRPIMLPIASKPLRPDIVCEYIKHAGPGASTLLPPSILEEMSHVTEYVEALKKLSIAMFGGGNLTARAGNSLVKQGVKLANLISATEAPYPFYFQTNPELWQYFHFDAELGGMDFRPSGTDKDVYHLFFVRKDRHPGSQGVFYTFPELDEYDTKDMFRPHPTLKDHWKYVGRSDTVIVFSNGEKLNPITIEEIVTGHPELKGVLVVGQDYFQPAMILEPHNHPQSEKEKKELIDRVWPLMAQANKESVAHGRIERDFIMLSKPEKPLLRAGKGTIQRGLSVKLYQDEIDELYKKAESDQQANAPTLDISSESGLVESIKQLFTTRLGTPELAPEADFFSAGIDSLQVINASRLLTTGLKAAGVNVDQTALAPRVIYSNPNFKALVAYINSLVESGGVHNTNEAEQAVQTMKVQFEKYTRDLPKANVTKPPPLDDSQTVIVTGTTGALGSYLLNFLIADSKVKKVICLNRSKDGLSKQTEVFHSRGLNTDFRKCEFLQADLSYPDFGVGNEKYNELLVTVDRIIHNGWPVNFNIPLSTFEPHIRGVRHFVDFSAKAARRVPIIFISSIGTVEFWKGRVPEAQITDFSIPGGNYGRSKMVSSLILDEAAKVSGVPTASIRVGQIAGSRYEKGLWNKQEWLPSIIASSVYLGMLPGNMGRFDMVDWMAIEDVANLVLDVAGINEPFPVEKISGYFHSVNPKVITWQDLVPAVKDYYGDRIKKVVNSSEWMEALKASQATTTDVNKNPGIKLIDSYEAFFFGGENTIVFDMERTQEYSKTAKNLEAVTPELMQNWCRQWNF
ncbi:acetyl-CoA synthetase-like protein [Daldinia decipiens]|uniref:acetyl-CoA synthetase-like protein n=1 Tax=Daldinia decipiens TaxID=326647 RepID=UPI0020C4E3AC|nr:acetyl-CoA synthetase-like protein [Daldinia decipiens]KAI1653606.1 acetyl-CoA synthetase-like protein [Daldinia decipiens]